MLAVQLGRVVFSGWCRFALDPAGHRRLADRRSNQVYIDRGSKLDRSALRWTEQRRAPFEDSSRKPGSPGSCSRTVGSVVARWRDTTS